MRVLHVENSSGRGGSLRSLKGVMPPPADIDAEVLELERSWCDGNPLPLLHHRIDSQSVLKCRRLLRDRKVDVVHINNAPFEGRAAILAARWEGLPVVSHMRTHRPLRKFERFLLQDGLKELWVLSESHRRQFHGGAPVRVLRNPVDCPITRATPIAGKIGVFGTLKEGKGQDDLLRACSELTGNWSLVIAGGPVPDQPSTEPSLKQQVMDLNLGEYVKFVGHLDNPFEEMASCSIVIDPSRKAEGLRRTMIEALLCNRSVLATRVGGIEDVVDEEFLIPPGDIAALRDGLKRLLANSVARNIPDNIRNLFLPDRCRSSFWKGLRGVMS